MPDLTPITREEMFLDGNTELTPITREEKILAGEDIDVITRREWFLKKYRGDGDITVESITITENGTTTAPSGKAYSPIYTNVGLPENAYLLKDIPNTPCDIATFTDGSALPMPSLKTTIVPIQDLHGYDSPWVGGSGRNLFNMGSKWSGSASGLSFTTDDDYVTISGTKNGGTYVTPNQLIFDLTAGTYYVKTIVIGGTASIQPQLTLIGNDISIGDTIGNERTFTLSNTTTISVRFAFWNDGATFNNYKLGIVVSKTPNIDKFYPYSNICPISGWSGANVYDDPVYGGTIEWNQLMPISSRATSTVSDVLITNNGDGSFTLNGTASGNIYADIYSNFQNALTANHIYMFVVNSTADTVRITNSYGGLNIVTSDKKIVKYTSGNVYVALYVNNGIVVDNVSAYPQCLDLTAIFGETKAEEILAMESAEAGSGVAYVSNLFPKTYYAYNTGTKTCVSAVNGGTYRHYTIPFTDSQGNPITVYGGELDVVNGTSGNEKTLGYVDLGTLTWSKYGDDKFYTSISDIKMPETSADRNKGMMCSIYKPSPDLSVGEMADGSYLKFNQTESFWVRDSRYSSASASDFKTAMSGVQLVYELATPSTFNSQPTSISSQSGSNNVWGDCGQISEGSYFSKGEEE